MHRIDTPDAVANLFSDGDPPNGIPATYIDAAWANQDITDDPIVASLQKNADAAYKLGFLGDKKPNISNLVSLDLLNKVLREAQQPEVKG